MLLLIKRFKHCKPYSWTLVQQFFFSSYTLNVAQNRKKSKVKCWSLRKNKNILRTLWALNWSKNKNIEAQKRFRRSYKIKSVYRFIVFSPPALPLWALAASAAWRRRCWLGVESGNCCSSITTKWNSPTWIASSSNRIKPDSARSTPPKRRWKVCCCCCCWKVCRKW